MNSEILGYWSSGEVRGSPVVSGPSAADDGNRGFLGDYYQLLRTSICATSQERKVGTDWHLQAQLDLA